MEIELTEGLVMDDAEAFIGTLEGLKSLGIGVSIDDFGTGFSSLSYLKRFPIDKLKIDQSFVRNLPGSEHDAAISRTVIALAHSLGLRVIAEGVETFEQLEFLRVQACDEVQGYYFAKPLAPQAFADVVMRGLDPSVWQPSAAG
jgi:EAL domain-containing protein (putative c-di-GMP-specific phosphodiesterase class I)